MQDLKLKAFKGFGSFFCVNENLNVFSQKFKEIIMRENITLECMECKNRNYASEKNKKNNPERVEFKKFCPNCKKHTMHKETK